MLIQLLTTRQKNQHRPKQLLLNTIVAIVLLLAHHGTQAAKTQRLSPAEQEQFLEQTIGQANRALQLRQFDKARKHYEWAHFLGMSQDSLFLLRAETFLRQPLIDSALAYNLLIEHSPSPARRPLMFALYQQRFDIYAAIGWPEQGQAVLDTLKHIQRLATLSRILPGGYLTAEGGLHSTTEIPGQLPLLAAPGPLLYDTFGPSIYAQTTLNTWWKIPLPRANRLRLGIKSGLSKNYRDTLASATDSTLADPIHLEYQLTPFANVSWLGGRLLMDLAFSHKHLYINKNYHSLSASLSYSRMDEKLFRSFSLGGSTNIDSAAPTLSLFGSMTLDNSIFRRVGVSASLSGFALLGGWNRGENIYAFNAIETLNSWIGPQTNVRLATPQELAQSTGSGQLVSIGNLLLSASDSTPAFFFVDQLNQSINLQPTLALIISPNDRFSIELGGSYSLEYSLYPLHWNAISLTPEQIQQAIVTDENNPTGTLFLTTDPTSGQLNIYNPTTQSSTPLATQQTQSLLKNGVSASTDFSLKLGRLSRLNLQLSAGLFFRPLPISWPNSVDEFWYKARLRWSLYFPTL